MSQHDTGSSRDVHRWLAPLSLVIVALAALMGWGASFVGLHEYGMRSMAGFTWTTAWLVPATFDGAAFACTLMTYRASIHGRSALRGRVLMWGFTAVSSWINWIHQPATDTKLVAAGLPVAAVAVFDVVLIELRADYEARHGRQAFRLRPGLLVLRWMVDRTGTRAAFRDQIVNIPVEELAGLGRITSGTTAHPGGTPTQPELPQRHERHTPEPQRHEPEHKRHDPSSLVSRSRPAQTPKGTARRSRLPASMAAKVDEAHARATEQGRDLTAADVKAAIRVPDALAAEIVADYTRASGQAAA